MSLQQEVISRSMSLSAREIKSITGWPDALVNDYISILQNFIAVSQTSDSIEERVTINESNIQTNTNEIATNAFNITNNTDDIAKNAFNIATNAANLLSHTSSNSEHGVTGSNVGTGDFAQLLVGGVVLLSELVADAVDSTSTILTADASAAPAAYSQTQIQEIVDLANDTKAKHNSLVTEVNAAILVINNIIAAMIAAKQMSAV